MLQKKKKEKKKKKRNIIIKLPVYKFCRQASQKKS